MAYLAQIGDKTEEFFFLNQLIGAYWISVGAADAIFYEFFDIIHSFEGRERKCSKSG